MPGDRPARTRAGGGPQGHRHRHDPGRHLDPQPRLRLDPDDRPDRLRHHLLHRRRQRLQGPRHQPEPRRRLSRSSTSACPGRAPRPRSWRPTSSTRSRTRCPPSRACSRCRRPRARARPASPSSSRSGATSTPRCRTCRPRCRGRPTTCRARSTRRSISKTNPEDQPIIRLALSGDRPADLPRRLRPQRHPAAAADDRGGRRDRRLRLPRPQRAGVVRRHPARGPGPHRPRRQPRHRARAPGGAGRAHRGRRARDERARPGRGDRHLLVPRPRHHLQGRRPGAPEGRRGGRGRPRGPPPPQPQRWASRRSASRITKLRGANAVQVGRDVKAKMEVLRAQLPEGLRLDVNWDTTTFIERSIREILFTLAARRAAHRARVLAVPGLVVDHGQHPAGHPDLDPRARSSSSTSSASRSTPTPCSASRSWSASSSTTPSWCSRTSTGTARWARAR